jgi:histidyl-tRNA synthetase
MATLEDLNAEITATSARLTDLRQQAAEPAAVDEAKKRLGELKKSLALLQNAGGGKEGGKKKERMLLKTAKVRPGCGVCGRVLIAACAYRARATMAQRR